MMLRHLSNATTIAVLSSWLALVACSVRAQGIEVEVGIEPASTLPSDVTLELNGVVTPLASSGTALYRGIAAPDPAPYVVSARWGGASQTLSIKVAEKSPRITIWIFNRQLTADDQTLDGAAKLARPDIRSRLEQYFVARDVYYGIPNRKHQVKVRALRMWQEAAAYLAKTYKFIAPDEEVARLVDETVKSAKTDRELREFIANAAPDGYFTATNRELVALSWADVALVSRYQKKGDLDTATKFNDYFLQKYAKLDGEQRKVVLVTQGVSGDLLDGNASFLKTLKTPF